MKCSVTIVCLLSTAPLFGGCAASDQMFETTKTHIDRVVNRLPEWAGGPAQGLPPRPTDPGYAAYKRQVEGKAAAAAANHKPKKPAKSAKPAKAAKPVQPAKPIRSQDAPASQPTEK